MNNLLIFYPYCACYTLDDWL